MTSGSETCESPRLNAREFERLIIDQLRQHIPTESHIPEHKQRREQLELAAAAMHRPLAVRRQLLDNADVVAGFAQDMSEFLLTSDVTENRALIRTFVKGITVRPGRAVIRYAIPIPEDSPIGRSDAAAAALSGGAMSSVCVRTCWWAGVYCTANSSLGSPHIRSWSGRP